MNVDIATYKAEFLSHYYEGRLRPRHAYAFGFIHIAARFASLMPRVVTGNLNAAVMMIAEKVSDRILGRALRPSDAPYFGQARQVA